MKKKRGMKGGKSRRQMLIEDCKKRNKKDGMCSLLYPLQGMGDFGMPGPTSGMIADPSLVPRKAAQLVRMLSEQSGPAMSKGAIGVAIGVTGAALAGAYGLYKYLRNKRKQKGKGTTLAGGAIPPETLTMIAKLGDAAIIASILGITVAAARKIMKNAKAMKGDVVVYGKGVRLAGEGTVLAGGAYNKKLPPKVLEFLRNYPMESERIVNVAQTGGYSGGGPARKFANFMGIASTIGPAAYRLYKFLVDNPEIGQQVIMLLKQGSRMIMGAGPDVPYGISYTKSGKIKRDRYSVYYGYYPKTSSGLTKDDFIKKGKKIISKKKSMQGKKAAQYLRQ